MHEAEVEPQRDQPRLPLHHAGEEPAQIDPRLMPGDRVESVRIPTPSRSPRAAKYWRLPTRR